MGRLEPTAVSLGEVIYNFRHTPKGPQDPRAVVRHRCTDLVMKAYVNEIPVLQARRVQDGAEVAVQPVAADQVVVRRPASTTKHTADVSVTVLNREPHPHCPVSPAHTRTRVHYAQHLLWLPNNGLYHFWAHLLLEF